MYEEGKIALTEAVEVVAETAGAVGMTLGLPKCAVAHMRQGRRQRGGDLQLRSGSTVPGIVDEPYKYLGVAQLFLADRTATRSRVKKEYLRRTMSVWAGGLNARQKQQAHSSWCAGLLRYFLAAAHWVRSDL